MEWFKSIDRQPKEGETVIGKIFKEGKQIKVKISGDFWDYCIIEWRYPDVSDMKF